MPTYEYECVACGEIFDVFHTMSAKPRVKCKKCGGRTKKRIGAGAGIIFKGSGFYETDYKRSSASRNGGKKPAPSESQSTEAKPESKSETKTESSKKD